jgi:hypothetical protein
VLREDTHIAPVRKKRKEGRAAAALPSWSHIKWRWY